MKHPKRILMNLLITDIEQLRETVKMNAVVPFESVRPFILDATDIYIEPNIGTATLEKAEVDDTLKEKICRALGPLAVSLATDELGIQYGDAGITVQNKQGERSPASDAKIAAAKANLYYRGMQALDRLLSYLAAHADEYPEYIEHQGQITPGGCLIRSARQYQDEGLVGIDYSTLSYRAMLPVLLQLQVRNVAEMLGEKLYTRLISGEPDDLRLLCVRYMAAKCAELHTSQTGREQRLNGSQPEFTPIIRPLYEDLEMTGNYYGSQATYYAGKIEAWKSEHPDETGEASDSGVLHWNEKDKKIFTSIS